MKATDKYKWVMDALKDVSLTDKARAMKHFLMGKKKFLPKKKTHADMDSVIKCALCPNICRFDCPVSEAENSETTSPSGKSRIAYFIETDVLKDTDAYSLMYKCGGCDACRQWCPFDFSLGDILRGVRQDLVKENNVPQDIMSIKDKIMKDHTLEERNVDIKGMEEGEILYFMGCTVLSKRKEIAEAMTKVFHKSKDNYKIIEDEWCCGFPLFNLGFIEEFKQFAKHNVDKIKDSKCKKLVCSCPTCAYVFKQIYPEFGFKIDIEIVHSSEYLSKILNDKKISCGKVEKEIVYHDPCVLVRKLEVVNEPRDVLKSIPGLVIKEPYFNKKDTKCCGRGGSLGSTNPDISKKISKARVEDIEKDAKCIVTTCPTCNTAFKENKCKVYDLSEIVMMGVEKKDGR